MINANNYIDEIKKQIKSANNSLTSGIDIFDAYHHFLIHCAMIYQIISPKINDEKIKKCDENELFKQERKNVLQEYFKEILEDVLKNKDVINFRNHFEHFDERLDLAMKSGIIIKRSHFFGSDIDGFLGVKVPKESKLNCFENGELTISGDKFNLENTRRWIDFISNYIEKKK